MRRWMMNLLILEAVLVLGATPGRAASHDSFYTRIRANDAPVGGRFSIYGYFPDSLRVPLNLPEEPGRVLVLLFRGANGRDSFLVPADLALEDPMGRRLTRGFLPLSEGQLGGFLGEKDSRAALWWVPYRGEDWGWDSPGDLTLHYGFDSQKFYPLTGEDLEQVGELLPWDLMEGRTLDPERGVERVIWAPDPFAYDKPPEVWEFKQPRYPESAKRYNFKGTVQVVARLDAEGYVRDAFVLHTDAAHELNVSALSAVMTWRFRAARRNDEKVAVEVVIPIQFTEESTR